MTLNIVSELPPLKLYSSPLICCFSLEVRLNLLSYFACFSVGNCLSIIVQGNDKRFGDNNNDYCMNFQRSAAMFCPSSKY